VATGIAASVKDFCAAAFETVGLDWTKYVTTDDAYLRPLEVESLIGDPTRIEGELGWKHTPEWRGLAKLMVEADLSNSTEKNN
jgi:GDPmannose 4,6-dehydratase